LPVWLLSFVVGVAAGAVVTGVFETLRRPRFRLALDDHRVERYGVTACVFLVQIFNYAPVRILGKTAGYARAYITFYDGDGRTVMARFDARWSGVPEPYDYVTGTVNPAVVGALQREVIPIGEPVALDLGICFDDSPQAMWAFNNVSYWPDGTFGAFKKEALRLNVDPVFALVRVVAEDCDVWDLFRLEGGSPFGRVTRVPPDDRLRQLIVPPARERLRRAFEMKGCTS